jgi:hypothetical protein
MWRDAAASLRPRAPLAVSSILKAAPEAAVARAVKGTRAQRDLPDMPTATTTTRTEDRVAAAASLEAST